MAALRKTLLALHRWLGLHVSLLLFVLCLTGSLATFGYQIESALDPAWRADPAEMNWAAVEATLAEELPHEWVAKVYAPAAPGLAASASIDGPKRQRRVALFDPATGALQGVRSSLSVQAFLRQYHKSLLLPKGLVLYGVISLVLLGFAFSGLIVYRRFWANLFRLRLGGKPTVRWADIHRTIGVWVSMFAILAAVTSTWYLVDQVTRPSYGAGAPRLEADTLPTIGSARRLSMAKLVEIAQGELPGLEVRALAMQYNPQDPVCASGQAGALLMDDDAAEVCMDPYSGTVVHVKRPEDHGALSWWKHTADELHYGTLGSIGGSWSRALYLVLGLMLSLVVLAGPMLAALRARASGRRPAKDWKTGLGVLVILYTAGLLAGSAAFTVVTLRRPTSSVAPTPSAVSGPMAVGGAHGIVARFGEGDFSEYVVHWATQPPPFEKIELVREAGAPLPFDGWKRPSARGPQLESVRVRVYDFAGTATTSSALTMASPPDPAPYGLSEGPTKVATVVKGAAVALIGLVGLAGLVWLLVLWRPIFFARKEP